MVCRHTRPVGGRLATIAAGLAAPLARVLQQVLVVVAAVGAYFGVRGLTEGTTELAMRNAERLVALERLLGLAWETDVQRAIVDHPAVATLANWIYIYGHWPFITLVLGWLVIRHRPVFRRVRNAMLASGGMGLVIFATVPMAPPRLAGLGLVDTVTEQSNSYRVLQPKAFTNQYAAMPSLHVGWNLIISLAVIVATHHLWLRALAVAATLAMDAAVVLTANHYVLDVVVGLALAVAAWLYVGWRARRRSNSPPGSPPPGGTSTGTPPRSRRAELMPVRVSAPGPRRG